eukprot:1436007-Alexandrium_andersonii.AAC.1
MATCKDAKVARDQMWTSCMLSRWQVVKERAVVLGPESPFVDVVPNKTPWHQLVIACKAAIIKWRRLSDEKFSQFRRERRAQLKEQIA